MCGKAEKTITVLRIDEEILPNFLPNQTWCLSASPLFWRTLQHSHTSRPLKHFLVNNSASTLLFQGSIGLEVCEKCIY